MEKLLCVIRMPSSREKTFLKRHFTYKLSGSYLFDDTLTKELELSKRIGAPAVQHLSEDPEHACLHDTSVPWHVSCPEGLNRVGRCWNQQDQRQCVKNAFVRVNE